jgi:hypothetical protein
MASDIEMQTIGASPLYVPTELWPFFVHQLPTKTANELCEAITGLIAQIRERDSANMDAWKQRWLRADGGHEMPLSISLLHPSKVQTAVEMRERGEHPFVPAAVVEASQADDIADWDRSDAKCLNSLGGES